MRLPLFALLLLPLFLHAEEPVPKSATPPAAASQWNGYEKVEFTVAEHQGVLVKPKTVANGKPWIWRTEFFGHEPQADIALLGSGWHVAYFKISDMYGAPQAIQLMAQFHDYTTSTYGLNARVVLEGFSRGGLYAFNFAATYPDKTAGLYLDAPVLDLRSWPGGKGAGSGSKACWDQALQIYGLTEATAADFKGNPIDRIDPVVKAHIPIIAVCGDSDKVVPYVENTAILEGRYKELGGNIQVILKPGGDHHPHSLKDPQPIVDFLLKYAYPH